MPQHCDAMHMLLGGKPALSPSSSNPQLQGGGGESPVDNLSAAVLLVGDAVHCFPPDLGQVGNKTGLAPPFFLDPSILDCYMVLVDSPNHTLAMLPYRSSYVTSHCRG